MHTLAELLHRFALRNTTVRCAVDQLATPAFFFAERVVLIMHHVVSATTNPAKIQAILQAFDEIFGEGSCHIESVAVESGVPEQPFGSEETRAGARNRVANARLAQQNADFCHRSRYRR